MISTALISYILGVHHIAQKEVSNFCIKCRLILQPFAPSLTADQILLQQLVKSCTREMIRSNVLHIQQYLSAAKRHVSPLTPRILADF